MEETLSRIQLVLEKSGLSQKDFAKKIGISVSLMNDLLSGRRKATYKTLVMIAKAFPEIDQDWIVGLNANSYLGHAFANSNIPKTPYSPNKASSRIEMIISESGLSLSDFAKRIDVDESSILSILGDTESKKIPIRLVIPISKEFKLSFDWVRNAIGKKENLQIDEFLTDPYVVKKTSEMHYLETEAGKMLRELQLTLDYLEEITDFETAKLFIENHQLISNYRNMQRIKEINEFLKS